MEKYEEPFIPPEWKEAEEAAPNGATLEDVQIDSDGFLTAVIDNQKVMIQTGLDGGLIPLE